MTVRRQHNHHRPRVGRTMGKRWLAWCACGWSDTHSIWHVALIRALFHSESLTS